MMYEMRYGVILIQVMEPFERPELYEFHGVSMTHYFTDNWENVQNFKALPDDILIATYPKAGASLCVIQHHVCVCVCAISSKGTCSQGNSQRELLPREKYG